MKRQSFKSTSPHPPFIGENTDEQVFMKDCMLGLGSFNFLDVDGVNFDEVEVRDEVHVNLGFLDDLSSSSFPAFASSGEIVIPPGGQPIDIPGFVDHRHRNVPLTPPDSDGPDSPLVPMCETADVQMRQKMLLPFTGLNTLPVSGTTLNPVHMVETVRESFEPMSKRLRPDTHYLPTVKVEPGILDELNMEIAVSPTVNNSALDMDSSYQCLKWNHFKSNQWHDLYDESQIKIATPEYRVDADKGFNFSSHDNSFVCQKKNHFQVTSHMQIDSKPKYVDTKDGLKQIEKFKLHLYGVKMESLSSKIKIEQSQADRSKRSYEPAPFHISVNEPIKETVGRMHFSETTSNNMRKKGKPNPDQRFFQLVVAVHAHTKNSDFLVCANASEKIIVRASNPGQFENDVDAIWLRAHTSDSIYRNGSVGINTDRPDESLCVNGNVKIVGRVIHPSDERVKENIQEVDSSEQLHNVVNMKIYKYQYIREYLQHTGLDGDPCAEGDTGVLAQEVKEFLPEAVKVSNDLVMKGGKTIENFLLVDKDRIFMENVGAVKELCKVTDKLENRIGELEVINKKLQKRRCGTTSSIHTSFTRTSSVRSSVCSCKKIHPSQPEASPNQFPARSHKCCEHRHDHLHCCKQQAETVAVAVVEPGICTPKFMQCLIVLLIFVMILSIGAIATLYVMQQDRNHSVPAAKAIQQFQSQENTSASAVPQTDEPASQEHTTPKLVSTFTSLSGSSVATSDRTVVKTTARTTSSSKSTLKQTNQPTGSTVTSTNGQRSRAPRTMHREVTLVPPTYPEYPGRHGEGPEHTNASQVATAACCNNKDKMSLSQLQGQEIYGCKTATSQQSNGNGLEPDFRILEENYMVSCENCSNNNTSFHIPFRAGIALPLTLQVNSTSETRVLLCSSKQSRQKTLPQPRVNTQNKQDTWETCHRWKLQVVNHHKCTYHFRVVFVKTESRVSCETHKAVSGKIFKDYYFNFVQVCRHDL